jgi:hypothetical protein
VPSTAQEYHSTPHRVTLRKRWSCRFVILKKLQMRILSASKKQYKIDARLFIASVALPLYANLVPGIPHVYDSLRHQVKLDAKKLAAVNGELGNLHEAYLRYRELLEERSSLEDRLRVSHSIIGNVDGDDSELLQDLRDDQGLEVSAVEEMRKTTPLWKVIREIIRHTEKIRIVDLEIQLHAFGYGVTRQAIESAIKTHPSTFRDTKRSREKFVSLK